MTEILPSVLDAIGHTPMIKLNYIPQSQGVKCEIVAKCEFMNPAGSIKDRIAKFMIEKAEEDGTLKPGMTIIEATAGNTGIGMAMVAAVKGKYKCLFVMTSKMSKEKISILKAMGAEVVITPREAKHDSPEGPLVVAHRLVKEIPNSIMLDQYTNPSNNMTHYSTTATEIITQTGGKVDMVVMGVGTGGSITGIAQKLKEHNPNCQIIAADPVGSILSQPEELNDCGRDKPIAVEGIGKPYVPKNLNRSFVNKWIKIEDQDTFTMARRIIKEEGLLCGASSGAALHVACMAAKDLNKDQRCVVIFPDGITNYISKFINDDWMLENGYTI